MSPNNTERTHTFTYPTVTPIDILSPHHKEHHPALMPFGEQTEIPQGGHEQTHKDIAQDIASIATQQIVKLAPESERFEKAA